MVLQGGVRVSIPVVLFNDIINTLGIVVHQFHDYFKLVDTPTPYPIIHGGGEEVRRKMLVQPNAYAFPMSDRARELFMRFSGRVLVPDRIRWDTAHVVAMLSQVPVLSNIFYTVKLRVPPDVEEYANKALVLWFNTTWGLLTVLTNREETEGTWTRVKMAQWRLLPVLDVTSLDVNTLKRLADVFDKYANAPLRRIPEQFNPSNPENNIRLEIDKEFIKALNPSISDAVIEYGLRELYEAIHGYLKQWTAGN